MLDCLQSGFRKLHSTATALLKIVKDIKSAKSESKITILVLINYSKAFDSVIHELFLSILRYMNFSEPVIAWFRSYLSDRKQCVLGSTSNKKSDSVPLFKGLPQDQSFFHYYTLYVPLL